jgi:hypothetical protein
MEVYTDLLLLGKPDSYYTDFTRTQTLCYVLV